MTRSAPRRALPRPASQPASLLLASLLLASCAPSPTPAPHYVLGEPYQAGGVWWYPRADLRLDARGLAEVYGDRHPPLTTDGEAFDQTAMAAANQTLPLPSIAVVTNLETGRQLRLRINDRGPATAKRMLAVTRRIAQLLNFPPSGVARVRLEVLEGDSQAAQNALPGAPKLAISAAPRGAVTAASLAPPPGALGHQCRRDAGRSARGTRRDTERTGGPSGGRGNAAARDGDPGSARSRRPVDRSRQLPGL